MGLSFNRPGSRRVVHATREVETRNFFGGTASYRQRHVRGGDGSSIVWGQLINTVPADSLLEDLCVELEDFNGEAFSFIFDTSEPPEKVTAWAFNPSLNSGIRGSVDEPLRVFGEIYTVERTETVEEEEVTVTKQVFLILGHQDPLVGAVGFVRNPDNDKGQALIHYDASAATVADGGPCGGA